MRKTWDWLFITLILALGAISLLVIYSINKSTFSNQIVFWIIGLVGFLFASEFDFRNWQKIAKPIYIISILSLLSLFFFASPVRGSVRWIDLGFLRLQPSEIAKVASILILSTFYLEKSAKEFKNVILSFLLISPAFILVLIEPDIGNAITFLAIWFGISFAAGFRPKHIIAIATVVIIAALFSYELLAPYQKERIAAFINPASDPLRTGYNVIQSKIAVGSGEFWGRGLGRGTQSQLYFLPESTSDFIFASIAEQLGFFGAAILLGIFYWMIVRLLGFIKEATRFGQLVLIGIISFLLIQSLINVGMNMGLLPVTGITFPLISAGGSSLISTLFLLGITLNIVKNSSLL